MSINLFHPLLYMRPCPLELAENGFAFHRAFVRWLCYSLKRCVPPFHSNRLMIGAPFGVKIIDGRWTDVDLKECIFLAYNLCKQNNYIVYSSHIIEDFGANMRQLNRYVIEDIREVRRSAIYVGITDGSNSNGMAVELGVAVACGIYTILFVHESAKTVTFLEEIVRANNGLVFSYLSANDVVDQLYTCLKFKIRLD
jgi:hypothetical protein